ncbi:MAG: futalosine hydrolase [Bacteroidia bacterium]
MKILIVAATKYEIDPTILQCENTNYLMPNLIECKYKNTHLFFLITGVGMVATAYYTGKIVDDTFDAAFNVGICGSFNQHLELGTVVNVYEDVFSELGAESGTDFLSTDELALAATTKITNLKYGAINQILELLPKVNGITVNTVHGNEASINKVFDKFHPMVESMEGAAFMFVCENENIPYAQIRTVSNFVEVRNKDKWNIPLAIDNLNKKLIEIIDYF